MAMLVRRRLKSSVREACQHARLNLLVVRIGICNIYVVKMEKNMRCNRKRKSIDYAISPRKSIASDEDQFLQLFRQEHQMRFPNFFSITDFNFRDCFRLDKAVVRHLLLDLCTRSYYNPNADENIIPFDLRILVTLSFLMHGRLGHLTMLDTFKDYTGTGKLEKCIPEICKMILYFMTPTYIRFPQELDELADNHDAFLRSSGVPGVLGVVDSFYVRLSKGDNYDKSDYKNQKGFNTIKVQATCDQNYRFLDINGRFPGGKSKIYIWKRSHIRSIMEKLNVEAHVWLVGDRGYNLGPGLMIPFRNPNTPEKQTTNKSLSDVHCVLDKAIALLKRRFNCLNTELQFNHENTCNIIVACATIHNFLITKGFSIHENIECVISKTRILKNAKYEDPSIEGRANREYVKNFICNNNTFA